MTSTDPLNLDAIEARATAATPGPWEEHGDYGKDFFAYVRGPYLRGVGTFNFGDGEDAAADREFVKHARTDVDALLAEVRRLRTAVGTFTTLAERWEQMADNGDTAIGHFEGPAAATLDAEVGERGRTYRKAATDVRDVARTGRVPHDLMTDGELATAGSDPICGDENDGDWCELEPGHDGHHRADTAEWAADPAAPAVVPAR